MAGVIKGSDGVTQITGSAAVRARRHPALTRLRGLRAPDRLIEYQTRITRPEDAFKGADPQRLGNVRVQPDLKQVAIADAGR
jgi:hypothetical protein